MIQPLGDRVLVEPSKAEEKTSGGIIIPDNAKQKHDRGRVLSVGKGRLLDNGERVAMDVSVGDLVFFNRYSCAEVKILGEELFVIKESDILGIIK